MPEPDDYPLTFSIARSHDDQQHYVVIGPFPDRIEAELFVDDILDDDSDDD